MRSSESAGLARSAQVAVVWLRWVSLKRLSTDGDSTPSQMLASLIEKLFCGHRSLSTPHALRGSFGLYPAVFAGSLFLDVEASVALTLPILERLGFRDVAGLSFL